MRHDDRVSTELAVREIEGDGRSKTDWDTLRDVLVQLLLFRPVGTFPPSISATRVQELDLDNVEYLISEARAEGVTINPEVDSELTLDEVEVHPLRTVLGLPLCELFDLPLENATWFCSCVIDAYLKDVRALASSTGVDGDEVQKKKPAVCELCARPMPLTAHHLYPRAEHARLLKRTQLTKDQLQHTLAYLCRPCHNAVHGLIDKATLANEYASMDKLREHEGLIRWADWASRQKVVGRGLKTAR